MKNTSIWRRIWNHPAGKTGAILFGGFVLLLILIPAPEEPNTSTEIQKIRERREGEVETATKSEARKEAVEKEEDPSAIQESSDALESNTDVAEPQAFYSVVKVVDGDTIDLSINGTTERIRLIGLNTPETVDPRKPVECFGVEASNYAKSVLTGKKVSLEKDPSQGERDAYGRLLGYIILSNGTNFNKLMISEGYGYEYTFNTPYKYQVEFKAAQRQAESLSKGLWASGVCEEEDTIQEEGQQPATTSSGKWYVSSHHSSKYYYCEESDGWKSLSETYLKVYSSEAALLADFPSHTLHESCQ